MHFMRFHLLPQTKFHVGKLSHERWAHLNKFLNWYLDHKQIGMTWADNNVCIKPSYNENWMSNVPILLHKSAFICKYMNCWQDNKIIIHLIRIFLWYLRVYMVSILLTALIAFNSCFYSQNRWARSARHRTRKTSSKTIRNRKHHLKWYHSSKERHSGKW